MVRPFCRQSVTAQVGSGDPLGTDPTYNFPQGLMTDHRDQPTLYRLEAVMQGGLDEIISALTADAQGSLLAEMGSERPTASASLLVAATARFAWLLLGVPISARMRGILLAPPALSSGARVTLIRARRVSAPDIGRAVRIKLGRLAGRCGLPVSHLGRSGRF